MKTSALRTPLGALGIIASAAVLAACGSSSSSSSSSSSAASSSSSPSASASASASSSTTSGSNTAASSSGGSLASACRGGKLVGYSEPLPDPNFAIIANAIQRQVEKAGCKFTSTNANLQPAKQISDVRSLLQQGVGALVINPVDPRAVQPVIAQARAKHIPVIAQETQIGGPYYTNVAAVVEDAAADGARQLAKLVGKKPVAAIFGPTIAEVIVRENQGFLAAAKAAGLNVVATQTNTMITPQGAAQIGNAYKQRFPNLAGLWTFNDTSAVGAASAFTGTFHPAIVSINGEPEAIPFVKSGKIATTYWLDQSRIGDALAYAALNALAGNKLPSQIHLGMLRLSSANIGQWLPAQQAAARPFTVNLSTIGGKTFVDDPESNIH